MSSDGKKTGMEEGGTPALVPKLRFSEFLGNGGWTETPLNAAAQINPSNNGLPESFIYIDLEAVDAGQLKAKSRISRNEAPSRAQRLVERGDIIYQVVRPYQRNNLLCEFDDHDDYVASTGYAQLRAIGSNHFLYQSIHTETFVRRVITKCTGSNYPAINSSDLAEIELPIPPTLAEQQKIAECLNSLDELITAQARKVDALKKHKKGLMQDLFPREGQTQPRLRFPEFRSDRGWAEIRLDKLGELVSGLTYSPDDIRESGLLVLRSSNVQNGRIALDDNVYVDPAIKGANLSQPNDILICVRNGSKALIGKSALIPEGLPLCTHGAFMTVFRAQTPGFVLQLLQTTRYHKQVAGDLGATINSINGSQLLKYKFCIPTLPEQHRIADFLSNLDALLSTETQKLEIFIRHKGGLMQQLFPSPVEAEG